MTVNELIEMLKNYPANMRVLTLGYEGGLDDISVKSDSVIFDYNKDTWYYGSHEYAKHVGEQDKGTECLIIGGR